MRMLGLRPRLGMASAQMSRGDALRPESSRNIPVVKPAVLSSWQP